MKWALKAAVIVASTALGLQSATAADLGGDCCADLEERIAELEATTVRKGNRKVSLTIYGQVNQALLYWDDDSESNVYVVNNKTSTSHFGFVGTAAITEDYSAGFRIELEVAAANSDFVDQGQIPGDPASLVPGGFIGVGDDGRTGVFLRHSNWWIDSKRWGRITVGLQSNATDNIAEMDLSQTSVVSLSAVETWNEGFFLRDADTGNAVLFPGVLAISGAGLSVMGDLFRGNLDGGRANLVRYDTPVIGGFVFSAAWGEDDDYDFGLRYAGTLGDVRVRAGIGYHNGKTLDTDNIIALTGGANAIPDHEEVVGSIALLHEPSGLFVTAAGGGRNWLESPVVGVELLGEKYFYIKSGFLRNWLPFGKTSIYGEYYRIWNVGLEFGSPLDPRFDEEAESYGFGIVQHVDAAAMELYLAYRHYTADDITDFAIAPGAVTLTDHDIRMDMIMTGARISF